MSPLKGAAVQLRGLTQRYGATTVLNDVTLDIPRGCVVGLIGADGVGKSSLLAIVTGARHLQVGQAVVLGETWQIRRTAPRSAQKSHMFRKASARTSAAT